MAVPLKHFATAALSLLLPLAPLVGCASGPRPEALLYDGGAVAGSYVTDGDRYNFVAIFDMAGPMAQRTTIRLADGVPVHMKHVNEEFLLRRGRVFVEHPAADGEDASETPHFEQVHGLSKFDPAASYFVIVGPQPYGPFYRFDVREGHAAAFGTEWVARLDDDGVTLRPGPVFIDEGGRDRPMPLTRADAEALWGPPLKVKR